MSKKTFDYDFASKRLSYGEENQEYYQTLKRVSKSPFYQADMSKIFISAMALGY